MRTWRTWCLLVAIWMGAVSRSALDSVAAEPACTNVYASCPSKPSAEREIGRWSEARGQPILSLAELRKRQQQDGLLDYEVNIEAQLTFAARYWSVFYIQSDGLPAMVRCTDAASAILCEQPVGRRIKLKGLAFLDQPDIHLVSIELLPDVPPLKVTQLTSLDGITPHRDAYVSVNVRLIEAKEKPGQCSIRAMVNASPVEIHLESNLSDRQQLFVGTNQEVNVTGTISPHSLEDPQSEYSIRLMSPDQIKFDDIPANLSSPGRTTRFTGKLLFSDGNQGALIGDGTTVRRVRSSFANTLPVGAQLEVTGLPATAGDEVPIEAVRTYLTKRDGLPEPLPLPNLGTLDVRRLPQRATLEGQLLERRWVNEHISYLIQSDTSLIEAEFAKSRGPSFNVRVGDRVRFTGIPLARKGPPALGTAPVTVYITKPEEFVFVASPLVISPAHVAWTATAGCLIMSLVVTWNWMLRRQVNVRTQSLNLVSSHLRLSFDSIKEAMLLVDPRGFISGCNRQFEKLFGFSPRLGQPAHEIFDSLSRRLNDPTVIGQLTGFQTITSGQTKTEILKLTSPDQSVQVFVAPIVDRVGASHGLLWTFDDITEKNRLEEELFQAQKMEAVGRLAGGVAHDFNNLLTILRSNLDLMRASPNEETSQECLTAADTAVNRAAELTSQLLDFSRRSQFEYQIIDVNTLITRVAQLLRRSFSSNIKLITEPTAQPLTVRVDPCRLEQVLINMCINARDSFERQGGQIILRTSSMASAGQSAGVAIEVEDDGCGIPPEVQPRIFEPFFTTKKPGEGTGLGLSMALGIVEQFGGKIRCQSNPSRGTCMRIELPAASGEVASTCKAALPTSQRMRTLRVLVIDDEELVRQSAKALLTVLGHQADMAASGQEALSKLNEKAYDVILLDLNMPGMSGQQVYAEIRHFLPHVKVALCSGAAIEKQNWLLEPAANPPSILHKPYSVDELIAFLNESQPGQSVDAA